MMERMWFWLGRLFDGWGQWFSDRGQEIQDRRVLLEFPIGCEVSIHCAGTKYLNGELGGSWYVVRYDDDTWQFQLARGHIELIGANTVYMSPEDMRRIHV